VVPHLVGPLLELGVVRDAALQGDGFVLGPAGRLAAAAGVAAVAVLDDLGGPLQGADLADPGDRVGDAVPEDAGLEVLVRVEALRVGRELGHAFLLEVGGRPGRGGTPRRCYVAIWPAIC